MRGVGREHSVLGVAVGAGPSVADSGSLVARGRVLHKRGLTHSDNEIRVVHHCVRGARRASRCGRTDLVVSWQRVREGQQR